MKHRFSLVHVLDSKMNHVKIKSNIRIMVAITIMSYKLILNYSKENTTCFNKVLYMSRTTTPHS